MANATTRNPLGLLDLPPEIRIMIYLELFPRTAIIWRKTPNASTWKLDLCSTVASGAALIHTNRLLKREASPYLWPRTYMHIVSMPTHTLEQFLRRPPPSTGLIQQLTLPLSSFLGEPSEPHDLWRHRSKPAYNYGGIPAEFGRVPGFAHLKMLCVWSRPDMRALGTRVLYALREELERFLVLSARFREVRRMEMIVAEGYFDIFEILQSENFQGNLQRQKERLGAEGTARVTGLEDGRVLYVLVR